MYDGNAIESRIGIVQNPGQAIEHIKKLLQTRSHTVEILETSRATRQTTIDFFNRCHAFFLPGGDSDIYPKYYGQKRDRSLNQFYDLRRDRISLRIILASINLGIPLFGVCRGFEEIVVTMGGKLEWLPERNGKFHNPHEGGKTIFERDGLIHSAELKPGGKFEEWIGTDIVVNSIHNMGTRELPKGLRAELVCPKTGVVEAFTHVTCPIIATQFHPEIGDDLLTRNALFDAFSNAAHACAGTFGAAKGTAAINDISTPPSNPIASCGSFFKPFCRTVPANPF